MGVTNLREFRLELRGLVDEEVAPVVERVQRAMSIDVVAGMQEKTPVDRGAARGGLQVAVGTIPAGRTGRLDPSGAQATAAAQAKLSKIGRGKVVYITNNEPHFAVLDQGGFVPKDPPTDEDALARRRARRSAKDRKRAQRVGGHEGAPLVKGGYSLQAPLGIVDVTLEEVRAKYGLGAS